MRLKCKTWGPPTPVAKTTHPTHTKFFQQTKKSRKARPAVSGGFEPTKLPRSALASPTDKAQVLGQQIPLVLKACVDLRQRDAVCCLASEDPPIAGVVYLAARAASVRPCVLPVAVHDANAIPSPLLVVCIYIYI